MGVCKSQRGVCKVSFPIKKKYIIIDSTNSQDNPDVHTQTIEGRWYCVKRWLPSSGR